MWEKKEKEKNDDPGTLSDQNQDEATKNFACCRPNLQVKLTFG